MKINKCRVCSGSNLTECIDLGMQPWCNDFVSKEQVGKENKYPLALAFCDICGTLQVNYTVPKEIMYNDHTYLSGMNKSMKNHFHSISSNVINNYLKNNDGLVVDIGSNDGTLLQTYKDLGMSVLGVEPGEKPSEIAIKNSIPTLKRFFDYDCSVEISNSHGKAKVISAANVFYHVEDLHSIVKGIKFLLDDDGVIAIQASYLPNLIKNNAFDIMYHEHLLYYRIENLNYLFNLYDLEIFDYEMADVHGGSIIAYANHCDNRKIEKKVHNLIEKEREQGYNKVNLYRQFNENIKTVKIELRKMIKKIKKKNEIIYAYGAPAKGTVMLNYCGLSSNEIDFAVEVNSLKFDLYIPCTGIKIINEEEALEPDYYLMLSWNFANEFFKSKEYKEGKRKFIIPLPKPKIYHK